MSPNVQLDAKKHEESTGPSAVLIVCALVFGMMFGAAMYSLLVDKSVEPRFKQGPCFVDDKGRVNCAWSDSSKPIRLYGVQEDTK